MASKRPKPASKRPNPASHSDARPLPPIGRRIDRHPATTADDKPGTLRVVIADGDTGTEILGEDALKRLPSLIGKADAPIWVDLIAPTPSQAQEVGAALSLHPLIVEDVLEGNQRAKIESTDGVVHIVLFHLEYGDHVSASELDIVLGDGFLLTVHDGDWDPRTAHHLQGGIGVVLKRGPDHLLWAIADDLIDGYFPFADRIGDAIDEVQDAVVRKATPDTLEGLFLLKRELIQVRRAISPVREVFNQLTNRDEALISEDEIVYFRDIYDHVIRLTDELDNYRELASATLDVYLTMVNNNLSVIMKRLTGVTVILAGIGAIAGIFGMSEAGAALGGAEAGGFWLITGFVVTMAAMAGVVLRRIDWI
jgi:magnesium transporter